MRPFNHSIQQTLLSSLLSLFVLMVASKSFALTCYDLLPNTLHSHILAEDFFHGEAQELLEGWNKQTSFENHARQQEPHSEAQQHLVNLVLWSRGGAHKEFNENKRVAFAAVVANNRSWQQEVLSAQGNRTLLKQKAALWALRFSLETHTKLYYVLPVVSDALGLPLITLRRVPELLATLMGEGGYPINGETRLVLSQLTLKLVSEYEGRVSSPGFNADNDSLIHFPALSYYSRTRVRNLDVIQWAEHRFERQDFPFGDPRSIEFLENWIFFRERSQKTPFSYHFPSQNSLVTVEDYFYWLEHLDEVPLELRPVILNHNSIGSLQHWRLSAERTSWAFTQIFKNDPGVLKINFHTHGAQSVIHAIFPYASSRFSDHEFHSPAEHQWNNAVTIELPSEALGPIGTDIHQISQDFRVLGRTIVFESEGKTYGLKIAKPGERLDRDHHAIQATQDLAQASTWPADVALPVARNSRWVDLQAGEGLPDTLVQAMKDALIQDGGIPAESLEDWRPTHGIVFEANTDYFHYFGIRTSDHQIRPHDEIVADLTTFTGTIYQLAREGLYHASISQLFHNTTGSQTPRAHAWNAANSLYGNEWDISGRLENFPAVLIHTNIGRNGVVRDYGEFVSIDEEIQRESVSYLSRVDVREESLLGQPLFEVMIHYFAYLREWGRDDSWQDSQQVQIVSENMKAVFQEAFLRYRGNRDNLDLLFQSIDYDLMARQALFFSTHAYTHHFDDPKFLVENHIFPNAIVGAFDFPVDDLNSRNLPMDEELSGTWSADGIHPDLGPVNGLFPVTELIRGLYMFTYFVRTPAITSPE